MRTQQQHHHNAGTDRVQGVGNLWIYLLVAAILLLIATQTWGAYPLTRAIHVQSNLRKHVSVQYLTVVDVDYGYEWGWDYKTVDTELYGGCLTVYHVVDGTTLKVYGRTGLIKAIHVDAFAEGRVHHVNVHDVPVHRPSVSFHLDLGFNWSWIYRHHGRPPHRRPHPVIIHPPVRPRRPHHGHGHGGIHHGNPHPGPHHNPHHGSHRGQHHRPQGGRRDNVKPHQRDGRRDLLPRDRKHQPGLPSRPPHRDRGRNERNDSLRRGPGGPQRQVQPPARNKKNPTLNRRQPSQRPSRGKAPQSMKRLDRSKQPAPRLNRSKTPRSVRKPAPASGRHRSPRNKGRR